MLALSCESANSTATQWHIDLFAATRETKFCFGGNAREPLGVKELFWYLLVRGIETAQPISYVICESNAVRRWRPIISERMGVADHLAVTRSIFHHGWPKCTPDNMAALRATAEFRTKSPILSQLATEISILAELLQLLLLQTEHVAAENRARIGFLSSRTLLCQWGAHLSVSKSLGSLGRLVAIWKFCWGLGVVHRFLAPTHEAIWVHFPLALRIQETFSLSLSLSLPGSSSDGFHTLVLSGCSTQRRQPWSGCHQNARSPP